MYIYSYSVIRQHDITNHHDIERTCATNAAVDDRVFYRDPEALVEN